MTHEEIRRVVLDAIVAVAPESRPAELAGGAPLREQLDLDSMDFMNFVVELDERLGVAVPEGDYGRLDSLDGCVEYLARALSAGTRVT
jgi:acyl carrier protein